MKYLLVFYLCVNLLAVILYGIDKKRARRHRRRIPEATLLGVGVLGGAVGALLGMQIFRHKTKHGYFYAVNLLSLALHVALVFFLRSIF